MNLCLNTFVIQFPDGLLDTCSVSAPRALLLPYAHRGHRKDEDSYKECSFHVELSIGLTRTSSAPNAFGAGNLWKYFNHKEGGNKPVRQFRTDWPWRARRSRSVHSRKLSEMQR